jgi:hypothetical protein
VHSTDEEFLKGFYLNFMFASTPKASAALQLSQRPKSEAAEV